MKLLIADDHAGMRTLIREMIGRLACQVVECTSGEEAVRHCRSFQPDCVTMDFRMGMMDGITALEQIRIIHPHSHLILVTQFDKLSLQARARRARIDHVVCKEKLSELNMHIEGLQRLRKARS